MTTDCTNCERAHGDGRFCTHCGTPTDRHHTAETPAVRRPAVPPPPPPPPATVTAPSAPASGALPPPPIVTPAPRTATPGAGAPHPVTAVVPPVVASTPPAARYPLFADERPAPTAPRQGPATPDAPTVIAPAPGQERGRVRAWTLPVVAVLLLMLLAGGGAFLFLRGTADDAAGRTDASPASGVGDTEEPNTSTAPTDTTDTGEAGENRPTEDVTDLIAAVDVPGQAPASTDARSGAKVTFGPGNLTDDDATTAWRVAGDASGSRLTITFTGPVELREVGLINGYAKVYDGYNGYQGNRRVLAVRWILDDGTEVRQDLDSSQEVQMMPIDAVTTEQVTLEILDTSAPGDGRSGRDFTAISELAFGGVAG